MSNDATARVRAAVTLLRNAERDKASTAQALKDTNEKIYQIQHELLPQLFQEAHVSKLGIEPDDDSPGYEATLKPFYEANIAAGWEPERRAQAFEALDALGHGDLIKNTITIQLGRGDHELAKHICDELTKLKVDYSVALSVHKQTLTAWLKEQAEAGNELPPLDVIGATIGTVVKLKELK